MEGTVNGTLRLYGGSVSFRGAANETIVYAEDFHIDGSIRGPAQVVATKMVIGDSAEIRNDIRYWIPTGEKDFGTALTGEAIYDPELAISKFDHDVKPMHIKGALFGMSLYLILSAALVMGLLILATKAYFADAAKIVKRGPWRAIGMGLLYFFLTPIVALLLMLTVIGMPLSFLILTMYVFSIIFAKPIAAIVVAKYCALRWKRKWKKPAIFLVSIGAYVVLKVLALVPLIGWLVVLAVICAAFGALMECKYVRWKKVA